MLTKAWDQTQRRHSSFTNDRSYKGMEADDDPGYCAFSLDTSQAVACKALEQLASFGIDGHLEASADSFVLALL